MLSMDLLVAKNVHNWIKIPQHQVFKRANLNDGKAQLIKRPTISTLLRNYSQMMANNEVIHPAPV